MTILEEAAKLSGENRQRDYGHPLINHERIAAIWNVILGPQLTSPITPEQVAWCMIGTKMAREVNSPKRDNLVDVVGYVNCLDLMQSAKVENSNELLTISRQDKCRHCGANGAARFTRLDGDVCVKCGKEWAPQDKCDLCGGVHPVSVTCADGRQWVAP